LGVFVQEDFFPEILYGGFGLGDYLLGVVFGDIFRAIYAGDFVPGFFQRGLYPFRGHVAAADSGRRRRTDAVNKEEDRMISGSGYVVATDHGSLRAPDTAAYGVNNAAAAALYTCTRRCVYGYWTATSATVLHCVASFDF